MSLACMSKRAQDVTKDDLQMELFLISSLTNSHPFVYKSKYLLKSYPIFFFTQS